MLQASGYHKIMPFLLPDMSALTADMIGPEQIEALRSAVTDVYRSPDDGFSFFDAKPTPIISDPSKALRVLAARRRYAGVRQRDQAAMLGRSHNMYLALEKGKNMGPFLSGLGQLLCGLYNIRCNLLPFEGKPLSDPQEIINDILRRCPALGLIPLSPEFEKYFGSSFEDLVQQIEHGQALEASLRSRLVEKFHLRLWSAPVKKKLTVEAECDVAEILGQLIEEWHMTFSEFGEYFDVHAETVSHFIRDPSSVIDLKFTVARKLGYVVPCDRYFSLDSLPVWPEKVLPGPKLWYAICMQQYAMGLSQTKFCELLGIDHKALHTIQDLLTLPLEERDNVLFGHSRSSVEGVCAILKIPLMTPESLPEETLLLSGNWFKDAKILGAAIQKRRRSLFITANEIKLNESLSTTESTLRDIEKGIVTRGNIRALLQLLDYFKIGYDAKSILAETALIDPELNKRAIAFMIESRYMYWLMTVQGDVSQDGLTSQNRSRYLLCQGSLENSHFQTFLSSILKARIALTPYGQWLLKLETGRKARGLTQEQAAACVGIPLDVYQGMFGAPQYYAYDFMQALEYCFFPDHITKDSLDRFEAWKAWKAEVLWRHELTLLDSESFTAVVLGNKSTKNIGYILTRLNSWRDPRVLRIAKHFRVYNRAILRILLEEYREAPERFFHETGISADMVDLVSDEQRQRS